MSNSLLGKTVTDSGRNGIVKDVYLTELGHLLIKVEFNDGRGVRFINYNIGAPNLGELKIK